MGSRLSMLANMWLLEIETVYIYAGLNMYSTTFQINLRGHSLLWPAILPLPDEPHTANAQVRSQFE